MAFGGKHLTLGREIGMEYSIEYLSDSKLHLFCSVNEVSVKNL